MDYRKIEFGKADAKDEGSELPKLLIEGYYDDNGLAEHAMNKSTFLFLGYKGTGKTALGEHLRLTHRDYNHFITSIVLSDFPYKSFGKIIPGEGENESKFPTTWEWLLLIYVIQSITKDEQAKSLMSNELEELIQALRKFGILPILNIKDLVTKTSKTSFKISVSQIFEFSKEFSSSEIKESDLKFFHIIGILRKIIESIETNNAHFLIIDGLDEILTARDIQYQSIAALITQVKALNIYFKEKELKIKILILCRTDIFEKLPHPNKNKIRQDSAYIFDWFNESGNIKTSNLIKIANLRTKLVFPEVNDFIETFFPASFESNSIHSDLLNFTRHTPRDFLQLLKHIQLCCKASKVMPVDILKGLTSYSINYFLPEIKDELVGYADFTQIDELFSLLSMLRKRDFYLREVEEISNRTNKGRSINFENIFSVLFECSAIGHIYRRDNGPNLFSFKYRNRNMSFTPTERIILHKGVWKALNIMET